MKRNVRFLLMVLLFCAVLFGCDIEKDEGIHAGVRYPVRGMPPITDFSGIEYEEYEYRFPPVKSAVFRHNGVEETIAPDDVRLIRLLNAFAYSQERMLSSWRQGYVLEAEIKNFLAVDAPMLEIHFNNEEETAGAFIEKTSKIVICGDSYLVFIAENPVWNEGSMLAEQYWPYMELVYEMYSDEERETMISHEWGNESWIDLLEFAGFIAES